MINILVLIHKNIKEKKKIYDIRSFLLNLLICIYVRLKYDRIYIKTKKFIHLIVFKVLIFYAYMCTY